MATPTINSMDALLQVRNVTKCTVYPVALELALPPVCVSDPRFYLEHDSTLRLHKARSQPVELALFEVENVRLKDVNQLFVDGRQFVGPEIFAHYIRAQFAAQPRLADRPRPARKVQGLSVYCVSWYSYAYGHKLLEILPKLQILMKSAYASTEFTLIVPQHLKDSMQFILELFGISQERVCYYDVETECLDLERVVLCGDVHLRHPATVEVFDDIRRRALNRAPQTSDSVPEHLYVTRRLFEPTHRRPIGRFLNEPECISALERIGFVAVSPERLSFADQVALFGGAKACLGEAGSAMHNTVFSGKGSICGVIGYINSLQTEIAAIRNARIAYFRQIEWAEDGAFRVEPSLLAEFGARLLALRRHD